MTEPGAGTTLRALSGLPDAPARWAEQTLVLVDCQNTYTRGVMELEGVQAALDHVEELLDRARSAGIPIVHVQHDAGAGSPYDLRDDIGAIVPRVAPRGDEPVVVKNLPDAFVGTDLQERLGPDRDLVLAGFMTHMCINSTARGGFNRGYRPAVVAAATATRALPGPDGPVSAAAVQAVGLAAIADLFGVVVPDGRAIAD